jgi:serine protease inhibitor ecotin
MTEPISIMLPCDNRPKTVTISAELSDAQVALNHAVDDLLLDINKHQNVSYQQYKIVKDARNAVLRAGGAKP